MSASLQNSTASTPASCSTSRSRATTSSRRARPAARSCRGRPGSAGKCTIAMTGFVVANSFMTSPLTVCADELEDGLIPRPGVLPERGVTPGDHAPGGGGQRQQQLPGQRGPDDDVVGGRDDQRRGAQRGQPAPGVV